MAFRYAPFLGMMDPWAEVNRIQREMTHLLDAFEDPYWGYYSPYSRACCRHPQSEQTLSVQGTEKPVPMEQSDGSKVEGQPAKGSESEPQSSNTSEPQKPMETDKKEESTSTTATEPVNSEGSSSTSAAAKDVSAVTVPKASSAAVSEPNRGGFWRMSNWDMWWPKSDVKETETNIQVIAELPGVKKEDVKVEVTPDGFLVISGNKNHTKEETAEQGTWHTTERSFGQFTRRFRLPKGVESSQITGAFENGTLTVTVPKPPVPPQPESHKVEIH